MLDAKYVLNGGFRGMGMAELETMLSGNFHAFLRSLEAQRIVGFQRTETPYAIDIQFGDVRPAYRIHIYVFYGEQIKVGFSKGDAMSKERVYESEEQLVADIVAFFKETVDVDIDSSAFHGGFLKQVLKSIKTIVDEALEKLEAAQKA